MGSKKIGIIFCIIILFVIAAGGGYYAMRSIDGMPEPGTATTTDETAHDPEPKPDPIACINALPIETMFRQKLMVAVYSDQVSQLAPILSRMDVGGVIVMDEMSKTQIDQLRGATSIVPIIAVDEEGGTVQRYKSQGLLPGAQAMTSRTPDEAYELYLKDSRYLKSLGITTNFAPVVDVESRAVSPLPGRMFSSDPSVVASYADKAIAAMKNAGIQPVIKHFPGLGSASGNTDFGPATTDPLSVLEQRDLVPYQKLATSSPDVMIGNMIVPGLTAGQPAIWSPEAIRLLRSLGYEDAVIYSDSLTAEAIPGTLEEAAPKAWSAGIDMALIVQTREQAGSIENYITAIVARGVADLEAGTIDKTATMQSVKRILARKHIDPCSLAENYEKSP